MHISYKIGNRSALKCLDHEVGTDHTDQTDHRDQTDHVSDVRKVSFYRPHEVIEEGWLGRDRRAFEQCYHWGVEGGARMSCIAVVAWP